MIFFLCSKIDFTIDLTVLSSSNTNKAAIAGPNPPIMCRIVPRGWENEIILRLVNAASPHHAVHETRNVIIRNLASLLVFNLVYPPSQLLRPQPTSQSSYLALFFPGLYFSHSAVQTLTSTPPSPHAWSAESCRPGARALAHSRWRGGT